MHTSTYTMLRNGRPYVDLHGTTRDEALALAQRTQAAAAALGRPARFTIADNAGDPAPRACGDLDGDTVRGILAKPAPGLDAPAPVDYTAAVAVLREMADANDWGNGHAGPYVYLQCATLGDLFTMSRELIGITDDEIIELVDGEADSAVWLKYPKTSAILNRIFEGC